MVAIEGLGLVQGSVGRTAWTGRPISQFHSIKYAEAPTGDLRFRAPVSVRPWPGVLDASSASRPCPQVRLTTTADDPKAEDCLSLSIYTTSWLLIGVLWAALSLGGHVSGQQNTPIVVIDGLGSVQGTRGRTAWTDREIFKFHNIRYAEAPVGQQRFVAPIAAKPWSGIFNAAVPGRPCPQAGLNGTGSELLSEDCLTLSVYTHSTTSANRPVMVFIHGGAFVMGSASDYGPEYLLERDIVLVVIQYRLGPLGFLSTGTANIPGNAAMLDMIMALEWVSQNIHSFGGDNARVTLFGESYGAAAVSALLYSPLVHSSLFSRAIIQSGSIFAPWATCHSPKEGAMDIARLVGCDRPAERVDDCLRTVSAYSLMQAYEQHMNTQVNTSGYPDVSGACIVIGDASPFLPKHPKTLARDAIRKVELMAGTTSQEGLMFWETIHRYGLSYNPATMRSSWDLFQLVDIINERFGSNSNDGSQIWYQIFNTFDSPELDRANYTELLPALVDICGNLAIKAPVLQDVTRVAHANEGKVFLYSFDYDGISSLHNFSANPGFDYPYKNSSFHGEDLFYLFPLGQRLNQQDTEIAKMMVDLWTSFASRGVPTSVSLKQSWNPVTRFYGPYLKINHVTEERNNYFNEFTASTEKARRQRSAAPRLELSFVVLVMSNILMYYLTVAK
ncbi:esterase E4-like [Anopheles cruzii]|uniref:esterase E4-like n=1 Tax=Anopheles cruzii TaxID=68878 RepID=UPI0022EC2A46|nr:esterase E4-like [Anopheles cruzii]